MFGHSDTDSDQGCVTVAGPGKGDQCQFPFIFSGKTRDGCITESDPSGLLWCSTKVDSEGRHVAGGEHWAHCHHSCPVDTREKTGVELSESSGDLTVGTGQLCFTQSGQEGRCRLPASCIGATIQDLELNNCQLSDGSSGTCCVPISVDNIINIIDSPQLSVPLPGGVNLQQANDVFFRFGLNPEDTNSESEAGGTIRFASEEPAEDVEVDINFA